MTPEQRYWFDLTGYLHIRNAMSAAELTAAQEAAQRILALVEQLRDPAR